MKSILLDKHWKVFLILFLIPFLLQRFILVPDIQSEKVYKSYIIPFLRIVLLGLPLIWYWSIGNYLLAFKDSEYIKISQSRFKIYFFIAFIYSIIGLISLPFFVKTLTPEILQSNTNLYVIFIAILTPIHIFAVYCGFYCVWVLAKILKTFELNREVSFKDFYFEFIVLFLFPICIWLLQPKLNNYMLNNGDIKS